MDGGICWKVKREKLILANKGFFSTEAKKVLAFHFFYLFLIGL